MAVLKFLLENDATALDVVDKNGHTPLALALDV